MRCDICDEVLERVVLGDRPEYLCPNCDGDFDQQGLDLDIKLENGAVLHIRGGVTAGLD